MLSWEEYNTDEAIAPNAPVVVPEVMAEPIPEAPAPVTASFSQGVAADAEAAAILAENVNKAKGSIDQIDVAPGLEELEMGAARVSVDEKAMINCRADLLGSGCSLSTGLTLRTSHLLVCRLCRLLCRMPPRLCSLSTLLCVCQLSLHLVN